MQGKPLFLGPRRIIDIDFSPGIPLGTKISNYAKGSVGPAQESARTRLAKLAETEWHNCWYGVSYDIAAAAYIALGDDTTDDRLWSMLDIPTKAEIQLVEKFYTHWNKVVSNNEWTCNAMISIFPKAPHLNIISSEDEQSTCQEKPKPRRLRGKGINETGGETEVLSPESEEDDDVEQVDDDDGFEGKTAKGKGKSRAREVVQRNDAGSEDDMDVDGGDSTVRDRFLQREKGTSSRHELFEVPTRVEGEN